MSSKQLLNVGLYLLSVCDPIISEVYLKASLASPQGKTVTFKPLGENELPQPGDIVGLDAEFVTLNAVCISQISDCCRSIFCEVA